MLLIGLTLALVTVAALWDWRTGLIPNWLTIPPLVIAPVAHGLAGDASIGLSSLLGIIACGLPPYLLFRMGAIGGGDVKLFAALGGMNGFARGTEIFVVALLVGTLQACLVLFVRGRLGSVLRGSWELLANLFRPAGRRRPVAPETMTEMRLGPAILVGTVLAVSGLGLGLGLGS